MFLKFLTIFGVEVPAVTARLIAFHEHIEAFTHLAVKVFHPYGFISGKSLLDLGVGEEEMFRFIACFCTVRRKAKLLQFEL